MTLSNNNNEKNNTISSSTSSSSLSSTIVINTKHLSYIKQHVSNCCLTLTSSFQSWTTNTIEKALGWAKLCNKILSNLSPNVIIQVKQQIANEYKLSPLIKEYYELPSDEFLIWCILNSAYVLPIHIEFCLVKFPIKAQHMLNKRKEMEQLCNEYGFSTMNQEQIQQQLLLVIENGHNM
jgi:hypothetical protein